MPRDADCQAYYLGQGFSAVCAVQCVHCILLFIIHIINTHVTSSIRRCCEKAWLSRKFIMKHLIYIKIMI